MKKVALFLLFSLFLQGFFISSVIANEDQNSLQLPYEEPEPNLPSYRVYNTGDKVSISSRVPIIGLQFETDGNWEIGNDLLPSNWTVRENNGRVLIYNLSGDVLIGRADLFSYSGSLDIIETIAADRHGDRIDPPENKSVSKNAYISKEQIKCSALDIVMKSLLDLHA